MLAHVNGSREGRSEPPGLLQLIEASVIGLGSRRIRLGRKRRMALPDDLAAVLVVITGRLVATTNSIHGHETFVADVGPGELVGEAFALEGPQVPLAVRVEEAGETYWFETARFVALLESNAAFAAAAVREVCRRQSRMLQRLGEIATLPMPRRLVAELARLAQASPSGTVIPRLPTHEDLARRVATQREAVTKELSRLRRSGAVRSEGDGLRLVGAGWRV
ncbi:MAG: hypothetical protein DI565_12980 [Ancylobacter novellus]|uniref:HTH crp-type domain-containing protein n=1 Tax=Ancylobacter novellus TaxID=921 RepID=A0A2W5KAZ9_ANCNO|nr:MAG: hypothetical protein DI565_12980 [Ancylobacter novellus]